MRKTYISIAVFVLFMTGVSPIFAQTATLSASPTASDSSDKTKQIESLKDRLATKVAELRQSQRMAIYGPIKSVSLTTFTVETKTKDMKIELTDDIKIFQMLKGKRTELQADSLAKGDLVTVFGNYDSTLDLLQAKVVFIQGTFPLRVAGTIKEVNKTEYTITIESADNKTYVIDFETTTKTSLWNAGTLEKGGFSKLTVGSIIHVTGTAVAKQENRISAARIVNVIPDIQPTTIPTVSATISATIKPTVKPTP